MVLKIMIALLTLAAFIMGVRDGDCTAAIFLLMLLLPAVLENDKNLDMGDDEK